jgi:hypothetical protein
MRQGTLGQEFFCRAVTNDGKPQPTSTDEVIAATGSHVQSEGGLGFVFLRCFLRSSFGGWLCSSGLRSGRRGALARKLLGNGFVRSLDCLLLAVASSSNFFVLNSHGRFRLSRVPASRRRFRQDLVDWDWRLRHGEPRTRQFPQRV